MENKELNITNNEELVENIKLLASHRTDETEIKVLDGIKNSTFLLPIIPDEKSKQRLDKTEVIDENMQVNIPLIKIADRPDQVGYLMFTSQESFANMYKDDPKVYAMSCTVEKLSQLIENEPQDSENVNVIFDYKSLDLIINYTNIKMILHPELLIANQKEEEEKHGSQFKREEINSGTVINLTPYENVNPDLLKQLKKYMKKHTFIKKAYMFIDNDHSNDTHTKVLFYFDIGLEIHQKEKTRDVVSELSKESFIPENTELSFIAYPEDFNALFEDTKVKPFYKRNLIFY